MIKYGLISKVDANVLEKTIDLICENVPEGEFIMFCEVGVYSGMTSKGVYDYVESKKRYAFTTGIDNNSDGEKLLFHYNNLIIGNSNEVYNELEDNSQHLIFIDALHTKIAVIGDFFAYAPKVKVGGYLAFHDTGKHLDPLSGWQGVGDKDDPDFCLGGVRKALIEIGLLDNKPTFNQKTGVLTIPRSFDGWELIFDEADQQDTGGGICVFKKLY